MTAAENKKKWKKRLLVLLFIAFNVGVILWTGLTELSSGSDAEKFRNVKVDYKLLIPAAACCIGAILIETIKYIHLMKKICGFKKRRLCLKTVLLGRYYDNVTPSGIGGQPMQIYYLNKNGVDNAASATIPIAAFLTMQFGFIILALIVIIGGRSYIHMEIVKAACVIGIISYSIFPTMILIFTLLPKLGVKMTNGFVSFLAFLHLTKNKERLAEKFIRNVEGYSDCLTGCVKAKSTVAFTFVLGFVYQVLLCCIPYFVISAFGGSVTFLSCFATTVMIYAAITFIPTPGNAGAAEGVFYLVFSSLTSGYMFWAMLVWRFFVYYIFIAAGIIITLVDYLAGRRQSVSAGKTTE
ncbi:MAG: lysylphosphatidylglycerol synthase transmembrane domain-containing protein [Lachnospiraceae bacterium]|nr:lysylphosphatidylglycerol synthase transmembrane domain-containing protein [Lachnospiraceae bacterium]